MPYRFVRIHRKNSDDYGTWYMEPQSQDDIDEHFGTICRREISETVRQRYGGASVTGDDVVFPHTTTQFGMAADAFCSAAGTTYLAGMLNVENEALRSRKGMFAEGMTIYLAEGMSVLSLDGRYFEIAEVVESDTLAYPTGRCWGPDDVRYMQWNMLGNKGVHWYAKVGRRDVADNEGNMKWDTREAAEAAADWFLKNVMNRNVSPDGLSGTAGGPGRHV